MPEGSREDQSAALLEVLDDNLVGVLCSKPSSAPTPIPSQPQTRKTHLDIHPLEELSNLVRVHASLVDRARRHLVLANNLLADRDPVIVLSERRRLVNDSRSRVARHVGVDEDTECTVCELRFPKPTLALAPPNEGRKNAPARQSSRTEERTSTQPFRLPCRTRGRCTCPPSWP